MHEIFISNLPQLYDWMVKFRSISFKDRNKIRMPAITKSYYTRSISQITKIKI